MRAGRSGEIVLLTRRFTVVGDGYDNALGLVFEKGRMSNVVSEGRSLLVRDVTQSGNADPAVILPLLMKDACCNRGGGPCTWGPPPRNTIPVSSGAVCRLTLTQGE